MSYQVIARKYRPQRFADVVGQEHITQTLANAIAQKRIAHAYLFCGPRGTGKTTIARIFAKCLRCKNAPTSEPCNDCADCRAITAGNSMDMLEFDAASNTQVEKIRDIIIDHVKYLPTSGHVKLYLIDEVHMLSNSSFNALLKTLEEPPAHVVFLFATTDPEKLPPTILSRCQRFDLRRIPAALITRHLAGIAAQEKVSVDDTALHAIARGADGGLRDAESTLDQLISFCGDKIGEGDVLSMFGLTAQSQIVGLGRALLAGDISQALVQLDDLARGGKDLGRLLSDLLNHFRNLLIFQISRGDLSLLEVSEAEAAALKEQVELSQPDSLTRILEVLSDAELRLREAASKRILLEVTLLRAIEARNAVPIDAVLKHLNQLRDGSAPAATPTPAASPRTAAPVRPATKAHAEMAAPPAVQQFNDATADDLAVLWQQLIEAIGRVSPFTRGYLIDAHPVSFDRNIFTIGFDPEFEDHLDLVDNARNHTLLSTKLAELGHAGAMIKFIKAEAPAGWQRPVVTAPVTAPMEKRPVSRIETETAAASPVPQRTTAEASAPAAAEKKAAAPAPCNKDEFKNDPLIKKALEIFKGQIVEVRA